MPYVYIGERINRCSYSRFKWHIEPVSGAF